MKNHNTIVYVEAVTWSRESHGLFDYESRHISKRTLKAASSAKIIRIKNDIRLVTDAYNERNACENSKTLALLKHRDGVFTVTKTENSLRNPHSSEIENFWLVVKNIKKNNAEQEYLLRENDVIKLGRLKFRVRELNVCLNKDSPRESEKAETNDESDSNESNNFEDDAPKQHLIEKVQESQELSCRICLNSEDTEKNPLISPCACAGSVKHVHLNCLKYWIKSKSQIKSHGSYVSYTWKSLECELCHQQLPELFLHNDQKIDLIDLPKPHSNYIILETLSKDKPSSKTFYVVIATENDTIKLGRCHDCDVRLNDISVSRFHAFIRFSGGKFYLRDNDSKFGTLVLVKNDFVIQPNCTMALQIGRSVISFTLVNKSNQNNQTADLLSALSTFNANNEISETTSELEKIHSLLKKKKEADSQQGLTENADKVKSSTSVTESNSPYITSAKEEASSLNSQLFNLTLDKDKNSFSHLQELFDNQYKLRINCSRARSNEEGNRGRKNILNEMKDLLNIDDEEDGSEEKEDKEDKFDFDFGDLRYKV